MGEKDLAEDILKIRRERIAVSDAKLVDRIRGEDLVIKQPPDIGWLAPTAYACVLVTLALVFLGIFAYALSHSEVLQPKREAKVQVIGNPVYIPPPPVKESVSSKPEPSVSIVKHIIDGSNAFDCVHILETKEIKCIANE